MAARGEGVDRNSNARGCSCETDSSLILLHLSKLHVLYKHNSRLPPVLVISYARCKADGYLRPPASALQRVLAENDPRVIIGRASRTGMGSQGLSGLALMPNDEKASRGTSDALPSPVAVDARWKYEPRHLRLFRRRRDLRLACLSCTNFWCSASRFASASDTCAGPAAATSSPSSTRRRGSLAPISPIAWPLLCSKPGQMAKLECIWTDRHSHHRIFLFMVSGSSSASWDDTPRSIVPVSGLDPASISAFFISSCVDPYEMRR